MPYNQYSMWEWNDETRLQRSTKTHRLSGKVFTMRERVIRIAIWTTMISVVIIAGVFWINTLTQAASTPPPSELVDIEPDSSSAVATFAAGCFWGVEHAFRNVDGVLETTVGYTDGRTERPTYREVCSNETGHAEAVLIRYDPDAVTYTELLETFWSIHDPTQLNRQGPDIGSQYRSAIFVHTSEQDSIARVSLRRVQSQFEKPIVTDILPAAPFWRAEEYHQQYLEKLGRPSCFTR